MGRGSVRAESRVARNGGMIVSTNPLALAAIADRLGICSESALSTISLLFRQSGMNPPLCLSVFGWNVRMVVPLDSRIDLVTLREFHDSVQGLNRVSV